jgi:hypothetical protein
MGAAASGEGVLASGSEGVAVGRGQADVGRRGLGVAHGRRVGE